MQKPIPQYFQNFAKFCCYSKIRGGNIMKYICSGVLENEMSKERRKTTENSDKKTKGHKSETLLNSKAKFVIHG